MSFFLYTHNVELPADVKIFSAKAWLSEIDVHDEIDYTLQTSYDYTLHPPKLIKYIFSFDNPRHATAFKLVWG